MTQVQLEAGLALFEHVRQLGEAILIAGLICEILVVAYLHGTGGERRASIFSVIIIILGVGLENFASGRSDLVVREMRAPRSISMPALSAAASKFPGTKFDLGVHVDVEPMILLDEIEVALLRAHWIEQPAAPVVERFNRGEGTTLIGERTVLGVWVLHPVGNSHLDAVALALITELRRQGILTQDTRETQPAPANADMVHIWVGVKP